MFNIFLFSSSIFFFAPQIDKPSKEEKQFTDSLSRVYNKNVVGYTTINGKITHIQYIKNGREYELSLTGFRIEKPTNNTNKRKN